MTLRFKSFAALIAFAALAACSSHGSMPSALPQTPAFAGSAQPLDEALLAPPACKGQKTTKTHSTVSDKLLTSGGRICIPSFGGFGGTVAYPPANPSIVLTLISSTTNYTGKLPSLHSGQPIFYLQIAIPSGTTFGTGVPAGGGLTAASITAGKAYTVYGQAKIDGFPFNFTPCTAVATKGKYGGVIGGVGTLLKGQSVPGAASGVIEIYAGKSATGKC